MVGLFFVNSFKTVLFECCTISMTYFHVFFERLGRTYIPYPYVFFHHSKISTNILTNLPGYTVRSSLYNDCWGWRLITIGLHVSLQITNFCLRSTITDNYRWLNLVNYVVNIVYCFQLKMMSCLLCM